MNARTKKIAIITTVLCIIAISATVWSVLLVNQQSAMLSQQIEAIQADQEQQSVFTRLQQTSSKTEPVRQQLQGYFLQSQSDSIDFLNYIEAQAAQSGIELETLTPKETTRDGQTYLSVGYIFTGSLLRVENFILQLENIPYVSELMSLRLVQTSPSTWEAAVTINVHVLNYEEA